MVLLLGESLIGCGKTDFCSGKVEEGKDAEKKKSRKQ